MDPQNPYDAPRAPLDQQAGADDLGTDAQQPLAGAGARLGARLLDGLVEGAPMLVGSIAGGLLLAANNGDSVTGLVLFGLGSLGFLALTIYQIVRLVKTGQTLGKKWLHIKVVRMDGGPVSFGNHFVRGLVFGLLGWISALFIFRADRRCLHDLAGETKVIETGE